MIRRLISSAHFIGYRREPAEVVAPNCDETAATDETLLLVVVAFRRETAAQIVLSTPFYPLSESVPVTPPPLQPS